MQPLRAEYLKGKVTTANIATAQVALSTIGVSDRADEVKLLNLDKIERVDTFYGHNFFHFSPNFLETRNIEETIKIVYEIK